MEPFQYDIDVDQPAGKNSRFWAACGLDSLYPLLFTEGGETLLQRMQEKGTCFWMRNHHTLSSLEKDGFSHAGGDVYSEDEEGNPVYHFEKINGIFRKYLEYGIKPVVEMDYLPDLLSRSVESGGEEEGVYRNRSYPNDWNKWAGLLRAFTQNLADTFGLEEIRTWYFEVWNEADGWPVCDWPQFHRMYDVFADAVLGVDSQLKIGGPGSFRQDFLHDFLEHVANGVNYVTGKRGTRIDFISHHIYGMSGSWLREFPLVAPTVQRFTQELMWISRLLRSYPSLKNVEFHLNEWGVSSHYEKKVTEYPTLEIRNSEYSACFFVKLIDCITQLRLRYGFKVSMLLYWGFCLEDSRGEMFAGTRSLTTAGHIPKPIQTAFEIMAQMGPELLEPQGPNPGGPVGCMASRCGNSIRLLMYCFDEYNQHQEEASGTVRIGGLSDGTYRVREVFLDREHHNTYRKWQECGSPEQPGEEDLRIIAASGELSWDREAIVQSSGGTLCLEEWLPAQSIRLIVIEKEQEALA